MAYDSTIGRFLTRDPSGVSGGANEYEAFNNDPINWDDPSGLAAQSASAWHHLLSKKVFDPADRASYLNQWGMKLAPDVDIHSAEWGWEVPGDYHNPVLHSNRNALEATWQKTDVAWLEALHDQGQTTITQEMLKAHVAASKRAYRLVDEAGNALQGQPATAAWEHVVGYFKGLGRSRLIISNIRNPVLQGVARSWSRRGGSVLPEILPHLMTAVGVYMDLTDVATSDVPLQTAIEKVSAWHGMFAGGALFGGIGEAVGGPVGGVIGAVGGGIGGYIFGEEAIKKTVPLRSMVQDRAQLEAYMDAHGIPKASEGEYGPMAWYLDAARIAAEAARMDGQQEQDDIHP